MFSVLMCFLPPRMRRVFLVASVLGILRKDEACRASIAKRLNSDRHIADSAEAFNFGFSLSSLVWGKKEEESLSKIEAPNWLDTVEGLISPFTNYDHKVVVDDLSALKNHLLHG